MTEVYKATSNGFVKMTDEEVAEMYAAEPESECDHPNVIFEDDVFDEDGNRISKHHWYCPDCDFLQVG